MKKLLSSIMVLAMMSAPVFLSSCGSSDDDDSSAPASEVVLSTPKFANEAVKITNLASNRQGWAGIEITENGVVIITLAESRAASSTIITGVCTSVSNGVYSINLPIFTGDVKISSDGTISIPGEDIKGTYVKASDMSAEATKLCRTWLVNQYVMIDGIRVNLESRKEFETTGYPTEFTVTKAGTFMVKYSKGSSEAGAWVWNKKGESISISNIASYMFNNFIVAYSQQVTVSFTINGTVYQGYLTEKK